MGDLDPVTGKFDKLGTAIEDSNKAWAEGTSLSTAYAASQETFNAATDRLGASLDVAGQKLGTVFLPYLTTAVDWLTSGVDAAIGFGEAVSTLLSSDLGGIFGSNKEDLYQEVIDKRAAEEAGAEVGDAMGEGVEGSDLAEAPGKTLGSSAAKDAVGDAAKESAEEFSKEWLEEFETQQADREIAKILARSGNEALTKNKGNVAGSVTTELENGLEVKVAYQGNNKSIASRLFIDGQQIGDSVYGANRDDSVRKLLEGSGLRYDEGNVLDLTGKSGEAALWRLNQSQDVIVDSYLDFSTSLESELEGAGQEIGDAFAAGMVPDAAAIDSRLESLRNLQLYDPEEAKAQGADNAIAYLDALKSAIEGYDEAKAKYLLEPDNEQAKEDFLTAHDNLQAIADQNPLVEKVTVDTGIFGSAMTDVAGSIDLADILADPEEFKEKVMDIPAFVENTFQPALSDEIDFMVGQWDSGYTEAREQTEDFVDDLVDAAAKMPQLFSSSQLTALEKYKAGLIDAKAALEGLGYEAAQVADAVERINFAQNADEGSYEDLMFYHNYIGPTSGYASWLAEESGRDETEVRNILLKLNTTEAEEELKKLDEKAEAEKSKVLKINDTLALKSIAAIDLAAARGITKTITIEYDDRGYSYEDYPSISYAGTKSASSTASVKTASASIQSYYPYMSFANEGYVKSPTLAVIGDRPGGEYVVGADRFEAAAAKAGGQTITVSPVYHINGTGLSADEVARLMEKNNKTLLREVADQIKTGKAF